MRTAFVAKKKNAATGNLGRSSVELGPRPAPAPLSAAALFSRLVECGATLPETLEAIEKWFVVRKLELCQYNLCKTANALGIHRNTLMRKLDAWVWNRKLRKFM